ncbi:MAG: hypothetical protein R3C05_30185 [Pirellulaceae bacterium]
MKRLGTRLGMLVGVIGLAVMAITQAQKDYSSSSSLEFADLKQQQLDPPRPIAADGFEGSPWPAPPDTQIVRGSDGGVQKIPNSDDGTSGHVSTPSVIQLAAHQQPVAESEADASSGFSMPTLSPSQGTSSASGSASPTFNLPNTLPIATGDESIGTGVATSNSADDAPPAFAPPAISVDSQASPTINAQPKPQSTDPQTAAVEMPDSAFAGIGPRVQATPQPVVDPATVEEPNVAAEAASDPILSQRGIGIQAGPLVDMPSNFQADVQPRVTPEQETLTSPGFNLPSPSQAVPQGGMLPNETGAVPPVPMATNASAPQRMPSVTVETIEPDPAPAQVPPSAYAATPTGNSAPRTPSPMQRSVSTMNRPVDANIVLAQPGSRLLEGAQSPSVTIHKRAPEEINVGKQATFAIQIRNTGTSEALNVVVRDAIPEGLELLEATPQPQLQGNLMTWDFGDLEPGGERTITLQMLPHTEGELGSVARLSFEAAASVRTLSTRPELKIVQRAAEQVLIGQQVEIEIEVSNPGTGTAYGVVLQEDVPDGLEHPKGKQLDNLLGDIQPGQVRRQRLIVKAVKPGVVNNYIQLVSEDQVVAKNALPIEIVAPQLAVVLDGPTRRFLERPAKFNLQIANGGTASATNVDVVAYLDRGLSFVSTEFKGQYDASRHAVFWSLAELPVGESGVVPLVLMPIEPGEQLVRLEAQADLGIQARSEKPITVETLAEITFSVDDDQDQSKRDRPQHTPSPSPIPGRARIRTFDCRSPYRKEWSS